MRGARGSATQKPLPLSCRWLVAVHLTGGAMKFSRTHVYRGLALKMKHSALFLLLGLALLPHAVLADQAPVSGCVDALEQLEALKTVAPVYKLTRSQERQYLADADRPVEIARLNTAVAG